MQTLLTCFVTRLQTKFLLLIIRASKRIYILVIGQISSFANILPANWFRLAYLPIFYPSNIFPRTVVQLIVQFMNSEIVWASNI